MHLPSFILTTTIFLSTQVSSHFFLTTPTSIGYSDPNLGIAPCGGFDPTAWVGTAMDWPSGGGSIGVTTTHLSVTWSYKAALLSAPTVFQYLTLPVLTQSGVPYFCEPQIPGRPGWAGSQGFIQIAQYTNHGTLYQCVRVKFTLGAKLTVPSTGCTNSSSILASW